MINVINVNTNEVIKVDLVCNYNGILAARKANPEPGYKFYSTYPFIVRTDDTIEVEGAKQPCRVVTLCAGFELKTGRAPRKRRDTQPEVIEEDIPQPQPEPEDVIEDAEVIEDAPQPQPTPQPEVSGLNDALTAAFTPIFANVAKDIEASVRANVQAEIDALKAQAKIQATRLEIVKDGEKREIEGLFCDEFEDMVEDVNAGWSPYLWGAAGCGKSHTCQQIADALGLPYYTQNMLSFAHEIAGYGNAGGEFVPTAFYKAFSEGGLFHLDEADRSAVEGLVTLNQALANGVFNFPVIGNVKAHPNFRFIASGNTVMNGADEMYTSGQQQDASFKRRLVFFEMHYDRRIELPVMAQGDEVLVDFVEDVRRAIKRTGTLHFVSYTETKYMKEHETKKEKALERSTFKSLSVDIIRQVYNELTDKENPWAVATYKLIKKMEA